MRRLVRSVLLTSALVGGLLAPALPAAAAGCPAAGGSVIPRAVPPAGDFGISGGGWGHGAGMSQYGAQGAALLGCDAETILTTYFPGTSVETAPMPSAVRVSVATAAATLAVEAQSGAVPWEVCNPGCSALPRSQPAGTTWTAAVRSDGSYELRDAAGVVWSGGDRFALVRARFDGTVIRLPVTGNRYKWGFLELDSFVESAPAMFATLEIGPFDKYVYGLGEVPSSWPEESLQAQAIAARSYAVVRRENYGGQRNGCRCDVYATTRDQVYIGYDKEAEPRYGERWVAAVDATRSSDFRSAQLLRHAGRTADAYYSSSHGGYSESGRFSFGGDVAYLRPVDDSRWDLASSNPYRTWATSVSADRLGEIAGVGRATAVEHLQPAGVAGRVGDPARGFGGLRVTGAGGSRVVSGDTIRRALGLRSTLFAIVPSGQPVPAVVVPGQTAPVPPAPAAPTPPPVAAVPTPNATPTAAPATPAPVATPSPRPTSTPTPTPTPAPAASATPTPPTAPGTTLTARPRDGAIVRAPDGTVHRLEGGVRWRVPAAVALASADRDVVATPPGDVLANVPLPAAGFRDGTVLSRDGAILLVSGGRTRHVATPRVLVGLGLQDAPRTIVRAADLAWNPGGGVLDDASRYPDGVAVRDSRGSLWVIDGGRRRPISEAALRTRYRTAEVLPATAALHAHEVGAEMPPRPGTPARAPDGRLWLLGASERYRLDERVLAVLGWSTSDLVDVTDRALRQLRVAGAPRGTTPYPDGSLVRLAGGRTVLVRGESLLSPGSATVAAALPPSTPAAPTVTDAAAARYPQPAAAFGDGLQLSDGATVFLVSAGRRRPFADTAALAAHGYQGVEALRVTARDLAGTPLGPVLRATDLLADGAAVTDGTRTWIVRGTALRPAAPAMLAARGLGRYVGRPDASAVAALRPADRAVGFPPGALIQPPGASVQLIVGTTRHPIATLDALRALGYRSDQVRAVSADEAAAHALGAPIA